MDYQKLEEVLNDLKGDVVDRMSVYKKGESAGHQGDSEYSVMDTFAKCSDDDRDCWIVAHCVITCNDYCCCEGHCDPHNCYHD